MLFVCPPKKYQCPFYQDLEHMCREHRSLFVEIGGRFCMLRGKTLLCGKNLPRDGAVPRYTVKLSIKYRISDNYRIIIRQKPVFYLVKASFSKKYYPNSDIYTIETSRPESCGIAVTLVIPEGKPAERIKTCGYKMQSEKSQYRKQ